MIVAELENEADRAAGAGDFARARQLLEDATKADPESARLWSKLSAMRKASADLAGALDALDRALAITPLDFSMLLSRALLLERKEDPAAAQAFGHAVAQAPPDDELPPQVRPVLAHARDRWNRFQAASEQRLTASIPSGLPEYEAKQVQRFVSNVSRRTRHFHQDPSDFHYPGLPEREVHDRADFPELSALEASTDSIRAEFEALIAAEAAEMVPYIHYPDRVPLRQWKALNNSRDWTAIHLLQNGRRIEANARHCPETMALIDTLPQPDIPGASPNAMFSLLAPRTRIPPHTGVANVRLVCHLPLIVPPGCGFRVGETQLEWTIGQAFVFDDTIEHEAWNDSDELRVVLIVDLWAPALSEEERRAVSAIIAAGGVSFGSA